jgi:hypothetical protein
VLVGVNFMPQVAASLTLQNDSLISSWSKARGAEPYPKQEDVENVSQRSKNSRLVPGFLWTSELPSRNEGVLVGIDRSKN